MRILCARRAKTHTFGVREVDAIHRAHIDMFFKHARMMWFLLRHTGCMSLSPRVRPDFLLLHDAPRLCSAWKYSPPNKAWSSANPTPTLSPRPRRSSQSCRNLSPATCPQNWLHTVCVQHWMGSWWIQTSCRYRATFWPTSALKCWIGGRGGWLPHAAASRGPTGLRF